jgi:hypothetical protein
MRLGYALSSMFAAFLASADAVRKSKFYSPVRPRVRRSSRLRYTSTPKCDNCGTVLPVFRCGGFCLPCRDEANQAEGRKFKRR